MSNRKPDMAEQTVFNFLQLAFYLAWAMGAAVVWLVTRVLLVSPEKQLQQLTARTACPRCNVPNDPPATLCLACGAQLPAPTARWRVRWPVVIGIIAFVALVGLIILFAGP